MSLDRLSEKIAQRDEKAFAELYEKTKTLVYSVCLSIVRNHGVAEELTQETFVTVWLKISSFQGKGFKTWVLTIAKNKSLNELRDRKREFAVDFSGNNTLGEVYEPNVELGVAVSMALEKLGETDRQIVLLKNSGMKTKEIAEFLKIPRGTVSWRYSESLKTLKKHLEAEE